MTTVRTKAVFALIAAFALVLAGCGGGDDGGSDDSAAATELEIRMDSFFFDPADTTVVADTDIDLSVLNLDASLQHNWVIINPDSRPGSAARNRGRRPPLPPSIRVIRRSATFAISLSAT